MHDLLRDPALCLRDGRVARPEDLLLLWGALMATSLDEWRTIYPVLTPSPEEERRRIKAVFLMLIAALITVIVVAIGVILSIQSVPLCSNKSPHCHEIKKEIP
jgi:hypothetical protein